MDRKTKTNEGPNMRDQKPEKNTDAGDRAETAATDRGTSTFTSMGEGTADDAASSLTLRLAGADDAAAVARLAALDSSRPPAQPVLLAEVRPELYAALSLSEHTLVADPFSADSRATRADASSSTAARSDTPRHALPPALVVAAQIPARDKLTETKPTHNRPAPSQTTQL
jgi:hypothetical protein